MKISIIEDETVQETEITIRCPKVDTELEQIISQISLMGRTIAGRKSGETYFLQPEEILYFESLEGKTFIYSAECVYESSLRLLQIEEQLNGVTFSRISKSVIVNLQKVRSIKPEEYSRLVATLVNGEKLLVSRQYVKEIKRVLGV